MPSATILITSMKASSQGRFTLEGVENHAARKSRIILLLGFHSIGTGIQITHERSVNGTAVLKPTLLRISLSETIPRHRTVTPSTRYSSVNGGTCLPMPVLGSQKGGSHAT